MDDIFAQTSRFIAAGTFYLVLCGLFAWSMSRRAERLLRRIGDDLDPDFWNAMGSPGSIKEAVSNPESGWMRFIRTKTYRARCSPEVSDAIERFRTRAGAGLVFLALLGMAILYYFGPAMLQILHTAR